MDRTRTIPAWLVMALAGLLLQPAALAQAPGGAAQPNPFMQQLTQPGGEASRAPTRQLSVPQYDGGAAMAGGDYVLGPGDQIALYFRGARDTVISQHITPDGKLLLPMLGSFLAGGQTIQQLETSLKQAYGRYLTNPGIAISLLSLRTIQVQILGQVRYPGVYYLRAMDRVGSGFWAAGGPTELASIRTVQLMRGGALMATLDLYQYFIWNDQTQNPQLEAGDVIFVPITHNTTRIVGQVWRPGTFEIKEDERILDLITMAGGLTPIASMESLKIENIAHPEQVQSISIRRLSIDHDQSLNIPLTSGDVITIPTSPTTVTVVGQVQKGGTFMFEPGTRVSYYLGLAGGYGERANTGNIKINRWGGKTVRANESSTVEAGDVIVIGGLEIKGWRDYISVATQAATLFFIIWQVSTK